MEQQTNPPSLTGWTYVGDFDETNVVLPRNRLQIDVMGELRRTTSNVSPTSSDGSCVYLGEIMDGVLDNLIGTPSIDDENEEFKNGSPESYGSSCVYLGEILECLADENEHLLNNDSSIDIGASERMDAINREFLVVNENDEQAASDSDVLESKLQEHVDPLSTAIEAGPTTNISTSALFNEEEKTTDSNMPTAQSPGDGVSLDNSKPSRSASRWKFPKNSIHLVRLRHSFGWSIRSRIRSKNKLEDTMWTEAPTASYSPSNDGDDPFFSDEGVQGENFGLEQQDEFVASSIATPNSSCDELNSARSSVMHTWW